MHGAAKSGVGYLGEITANLQFARGDEFATAPERNGIADQKAEARAHHLAGEPARFLPAVARYLEDGFIDVGIRAGNERVVTPPAGVTIYLLHFLPPPPQTAGAPYRKQRGRPPPGGPPRRS